MVRRLNEYIDNNDLQEEEIIDKLQEMGFKRHVGNNYIRDFGNGFGAYVTDNLMGIFWFDNKKTKDRVAWDFNKEYDLLNKKEFNAFNKMMFNCLNNDAPELVEELLINEGFEWLNDEVMVQDFGEFSASYYVNHDFGYCSRNDKRNADNIEKEFGILAFVNMYCEWLRVDWSWGK